MTIPASKPRSTRAWLTIALAWGAVLAALTAVIIWVGPAKLIAPWRHISPLALLVALSLMVLSYALRALRIQRYFHPELNGQFWPTLKLSTWHILLNNLLPMRAGEVSFPILMQRYFALSPRRTVPVLFWFRLLDLQAIVLIGLLAAFWGTGLSAQWLWPALILLPAPLIAYIARHHVARWLAGRAAGKWRDRLLDSLNSLPNDARSFLATLGWTWINWLVKLLTLAWVLAALAPVTIIQAVAGAIGGDLTTVLPIHAPGGFGTFEAGVMLALQPFDLSIPTALAAAVNLHLFLLGSSILAALVVLAIRVPPPNRDTATTQP
ncbi:lysylphosphatidylglycerol synthase transmembrane domain-containing protein [Halothiobacillus sp.]|uniref:lysylphosphatidylglycerol synthase transmembrane domain-containing protein n=1 Tax=Halothiobacillus sp. TaxID=1891311 RepID=UPI002AD2C3D2|nr:lysylphosphatidylglycerol synthase transmembrane domain-containing protein [Halothiobacillus sp.]